MDKNDDSNLEFTSALIVPRPVRAEVARIDLLKQIEEAHDARVIALVAPSGYGKTTSLAQYARATQRPVAWMTLSERQRGSTRILEMLDASLRRVQPTLQFERCGQLRADAPPEDRARALARDLLGCAENLRIIFDQAHHLDAAAYHVLDAFISQLAEGHQVLISAYAVNFRLADYALRGQALILEQGLLRFNSQEVAKFLDARHFAGDVELVNTQLEGWPAGLALASTSTSSHLIPEQLIFEALDRLPSALRLALPALSAYEFWSPGLPEKLGVEAPAHWLNTLRTFGLPITPLTQNLFKPHTILLAALTSLLAERPALFRTINKRAGDLYLENNCTVQAIRAFRNAEEHEKLVELLLEVVRAAVGRRDYSLIIDLLSSLPTFVLTTPLKIALGDALIYTGRQKAGDEVLREVQATGCVDSTLTIALVNSLCIAGRYEAALETLEKSFMREDLEEDTAARLIRIRIHILNRLDRDSEAVHYAQAAYDQAQATGNLKQIAAVRSVMLHLEMNQLQFEHIEGYAQEILAIYSHLDEPVLSLPTYTSLIDYLRYTGQFGEALQTFCAANSLLGESIRSHNIDVLMLRECEGDISLATGQLDLAVECYEAIRRKISFTSDHLFKSRIYGKMAEIYAKLKQPQRTDACLKLLRQSVALHPNGWIHCAYFEGIVCGVNGQWAEAGDHLRQLQQVRLPFDRLIKALLYLAEASLQQGQPTGPSLQRLKEKLALVPSTDLLKAELPFTARVGALLSPLEPVQYKAARIGRRASPTLRITTLNGFAVDLDGRAVRIPHTKSREILLWLALYGSGFREQIIDAIWGERNHQNAIEYFKISVRRLRHAFTDALGSAVNPILYDGGRYQIAASLQVEVDCLELKRAVTRAECKRVAGLLPAGRVEFLPGMHSDWLGFERSSFRETVYAALMLLAQDHVLEAGFDWATFLTRAIQFEPLNEEAYIALIEQWATRGQVAQAGNVYQMYRKAIMEEVGSTPNPAFHQRLVKAGFMAPET